MSKLLTKEQVVADFKINVLPSIIESIGKKDYDTIKYCWDLNLEELYKNKEISEGQKSIWTMPKELTE